MNDSAKQISSMRFTYSDGGTMVLHLEGDWVLRTGMPRAGVVGNEFDSHKDVKKLLFDVDSLGEWDTALLSFIIRLDEICEKRDVVADYSTLPDGVAGLLSLAKAVPERQGAKRGSERIFWVKRFGEFLVRSVHTFVDGLKFVGETILAVGNMIRGRAVYKKSDFWMALQQCGVDALPIVALISILVGMILAFLGSVQLKMFGAQIFVADLVGVGMVREMGALMTGIIMAGRTGASYAARLGSMQVNEEVDALTTMGFSPIEFLVLPRTLAMVFMMPLLCIYADILGIVGGAIVGVGMLDLTITQYYLQTVGAVSLTAIASGLIKSLVFGVIVALAGCMHGIRCGRSASAVGDATTKAVVSGIVSIIVWDSLITVVYIIIGF
jgi:phospholipid/cholesterol/gamma-HCH transport system permease protein